MRKALLVALAMFATTAWAATTVNVPPGHAVATFSKSPVRYNLYRTGCGRDARLKQLWGDRAGK